MKAHDFKKITDYISTDTEKNIYICSRCHAEERFYGVPTEEQMNAYILKYFYECVDDKLLGE